MKKYTIQDLRNGKCAVINDGTLEELREVLDRAFPVDKLKTAGHYKFYFSAKNGFYECDKSTSLPTQSGKQFLKEEEDNFVLPERWCVQRNDDNSAILNEWANNQEGVSGTSSKDGWLYNTNFGFYGNENGGIKGHYYINYTKLEGYTEITFEQFKKYVLNKQNSAKEKQTTMRKIKSSQAQDIINIACNTWKANLAEKWAKEIVLNKEVKITEDFYQEMRKACTKDQNELFDKIFGVECPYKEGELIFIKDAIEDAWELRYFSHIKNGEVHVFNYQSKSGSTGTGRYHAPAKGVTLPE